VDTLNLKLPDYYINRELSQLAFNVRVLQQAKDPNVPLLERLKFLCISSTNLDEFFEIRVSGLKHRLEEDPVIGESWPDERWRCPHGLDVIFNGGFQRCRAEIR
jgi:polyphosphate kinase